MKRRYFYTASPPSLLTSPTPLPLLLALLATGVEAEKFIENVVLNNSVMKKSIDEKEEKLKQRKKVRVEELKSVEEALKRPLPLYPEGFPRDAPKGEELNALMQLEFRGHVHLVTAALEAALEAAVGSPLRSFRRW